MLLRQQPGQRRVFRGERPEQHPARAHQLLVHAHDPQGRSGDGARVTQERQLLLQVVERQTERIALQPGPRLGHGVGAAEQAREAPAGFGPHFHNHVAHTARGQLAKHGRRERRDLDQPMVLADEHEWRVLHGGAYHGGTGAFEPSAAHGDWLPHGREHVVHRTALRAHHGGAECSGERGEHRTSHALTDAARHGSVPQPGAGECFPWGRCWDRFAAGRRVRPSGDGMRIEKHSGEGRLNATTGPQMWHQISTRGQRASTQVVEASLGHMTRTAAVSLCRRGGCMDPPRLCVAPDRRQRPPWWPRSCSRPVTRVL